MRLLTLRYFGSLIALCCAFQVYAEQPALFTAKYQASSSGLSASAYRSLEKLDNDQYHLENTLELTVAGARLGSVKEASVFTWEDNQFRSQIYRYTQSGIAKRRERVSFDWETNSASSTEDDETWQIPLTEGVVDKLGYQFLLQQQLQLLEADEFEYQIVDGDEIETHLYKVSARETLDTPLGKFSTIKIERIRSDDSKRNTTFWLAPDWNLLLVRLVQTSSSGSITELVIEEATVDNKPMTGLP